MTAEHELLTGDCLEVMKKMPSESVGLIATDPPFNIGKNYGGIYKDNKKFDEYMEWCKLWLSECIRLLKKDGSLYLFNYPENNAYLLPFLKEKMVFKRWMTWQYSTNTGHSKSNFTRTQHSIIFCTKTEKHKFNKRDIAEPYKNPTHPCQIPVPLLKIFIKASSNIGDTVMDPFAGSFSICAAAKELDRNSIGIDIQS